MTKKILVVYQSVSGFTREYAQMIAESIHCPIADYKEVSKERWQLYDILIFGGRVHAGTIDGYKQWKKKLSGTQAQLIVFATGALPNTYTDQIQEMWNQNFSADELTNIPHFYMPSGLRYEALPVSDKVLLKIFKTMLHRKKQKSEAERQMEQAICTCYDISSKSYIEPLCTALQAYLRD